MEAVYRKCSEIAVHSELQRGLEPFVYWHVTQSVREGYRPDAIGEFQRLAEVEALVLERRSTARDRTLGYFVSLLHHYLAPQSDPGDADVDQAVTALHADLHRDSKPISSTDFLTDTANIYEYIREQKQDNDLLADDHDGSQGNAYEAKLQWNVAFQNALELTRAAYIEACQRFAHRFALGTQADFALVHLLTSTDLAQLASKFRAGPRHVAAPRFSTNGEEASAESCRDGRIDSTSHTIANSLPTFDPEHVLNAGQQFRAACIGRLRQHQPSADRALAAGTELEVVLSEALNLETNPERLVERVRQQWTTRILESSSLSATDDQEATIRGAKEMLSSALQILGQRQGRRNLTLRIDALNLRGHTNNQLAALKLRHRANYLSLAIADWSESSQLDPSQNDIIQLLAKTQAGAESSPNGIAAESDEEPVSTDNTLSNESSTLKSSLIASRQKTVPPQTAAVSIQKGGKVAVSSTSKAAKGSNGAKRPSSGAKSGKDSSTSREKTILESPFFRSDLVTGLMVDSVLALAFPHRALRETLRLPSACEITGASQDHKPMLDRLAESHHQTTKALTAENKEQLRAAIKAVSAVLALPDLQQVTRNDLPAKALQYTSLRLVLGTLHLLLNELVKAQTELELVSNALKPKTRAPRRVDEEQTSTTAGGIAGVMSNGGGRGGEQDELAIPRMQTRVQGQTLFLLAKTCWMANKVQEAIKFFRWFAKWYFEQQTERTAERKEADRDERGGQVDQALMVDLDEMDMGWWDKVVVVTKT